MAWCPQCGAEYREGIAECAKCGVALTEEAPPVATAPVRLPPRLQWIGDAGARAWAYLSEARQALRRHRGLLVLPLAVAVFNAVESGAGNYAMFRYTELGRDWAVHKSFPPNPPAGQPVFRTRDLLPVRSAISRAAYPVPGVGLQGTRQLATFALIGTGGAPLRNLIPWLLALLVAPVPPALVLAGYYGVVGRTLAEGAPTWASFWTYVRRYSAGFWLFVVLLAILTEGPVVVGVSFGPAYIPYQAFGPAALVIAFAFSLTLVAMVVDEAGVGRALRSGVAVLLRDLPIALLLLFAWTVVLALVALLQYVIGSARGALLPSPDIAVAQLSTIPLKALAEALLAAVGTWFLVATFLWYRDRRPVSALPDPS